jgi:DNA-binding NarL/FixJ family response regulator
MGRRTGDAKLAMSTQTKLPRIVLVDDHPAVLDQTIELLSSEFEIVAAVEEGRDLLDLIPSEQIDLMVLDITLPDMTGIELALRLRRAGNKAKIVFLTVHCDPDYAREAFEVGASGFVIKPRLASDLIPAMRLALANKQFISPCAELKELGYELNVMGPTK